ncbi:hypothetical protein D3C78_1199950 [compost metagenome]
MPATHAGAVITDRHALSGKPHPRGLLGAGVLDHRSATPPLIILLRLYRGTGGGVDIADNRGSVPPVCLLALHHGFLRTLPSGAVNKVPGGRDWNSAWLDTLTGVASRWGAAPPPP